MTRLTILLFTLLLSSVGYAEQQIAKGTWTKIDYDAAGTWSITKEDGKLIVSLSDDFETKDGPDLFILFSTKKLSEVNNSNANQSSIQVGMLKTNDKSLFFKKMKGAQRFELPGDTDLSKYQSILIHCVQFSHLWAGAELNN
ncbi:MAG: DM13 domain-containing protein [Chromatiales bacterium]|nr:DM13 domain-containing protein [Chromatiales bacterium]